MHLRIRDGLYLKLAVQATDMEVMAGHLRATGVVDLSCDISQRLGCVEELSRPDDILAAVVVFPEHLHEQVLGFVVLHNQGNRLIDGAGYLATLRFERQYCCWDVHLLKLGAVCTICDVISTGESQRKEMLFRTGKPSMVMKSRFGKATRFPTLASGTAAQRTPQVSSSMK